MILHASAWGKRQRTRTGRGPDAGRTLEFEQTDADRTRAWPFLPKCVLTPPLRILAVPFCFRVDAIDVCDDDNILSSVLRPSRFVSIPWAKTGRGRHPPSEAVILKEVICVYSTPERRGSSGLRWRGVGPSTGRLRK
eukprot:gene11697-biopygen19900